MVRVPESAVTRGPGSISAQPVREAIEIGSAAADSIGATTDLFARLAIEDRKVELTGLSASMENDLAELQFRIANDPQFNSVALADEEFQRGAQDIGNGILDASTSTAVNDAISKQFLTSVLQGRTVVKNSAYTRQKDTALAGLDTADELFGRAYAAAPNDAKREQIIALQVRNVVLSEYETDQAKGDRIRKFRLDMDMGHVRSKIDLAASNPNADEANRLLREAEDMLLDPQQLQGMDELKRQAMMRTLNTARNRVDSNTKKLRGEIEDNTAKAAILQIGEFNRIGGDEYTSADLERDAPHMSVADLRATQTAMKRQGVVIITDNDTLEQLNEEIDEDNADVVDHIYKAFGADLLTIEVFQSLLAKHRTYNDDPIQFSPYKQSSADIREALGPNKFTDLSLRGPAVLRKNNAINELDAYRYAHPKATPTAIRAERDRILKAYIPVSTGVFNTLPLPYSLNERNGLSIEDLTKADAKLTDDYDAGVVDDWVYGVESNNIATYKFEIEKLNSRKASEGASQ